MSYVLISPTRATVVFRLPAEFACAYSPGFDLHVSGTGQNEQQAVSTLVWNLRDLANQLMQRAQELEEGKT